MLGDELRAMRDYRELERKLKEALGRNSLNLDEITEAYREFISVCPPQRLRTVWPPAPPAKEITPEEAERLYRGMMRSRQ